MRLGVLSVTFGNRTLHDLANKIADAGFTSAHVELKHIREFQGLGPGHMSTGFANYVGEVFERAGVHIPALGCYTNLIHTNESERRRGIQLFKENIRFARDFGASVVTTETGTANPVSQWEDHPDNQSERNWQLLTDTVSELVEEAARWGVFVALEGYTKNVVNTVERMQRMLEQFPQSNLGIVMDPCNYIDPSNMDHQDGILHHAFHKIGMHTVIAHAKDFRIDEQGDMIQPGAGTGFLNYDLYVTLLHQAKPHVDLFVEHFYETETAQIVHFVRGVIRNVTGEEGF